MKLAWFTPLSVYSAIGHCSELILRELVKHAEVTVFASDIGDLSQARTHEFETRLLWGVEPTRVVAELGSFDSVIYNLGNHYEMHNRTYEVALRKPGIVILHDLVMAHMFAGRYLVGLNDPLAFLAELEYAHGLPGRELGERILSGQAADVFDTAAMLEFNMAKSATRGSLGIVVHSEFARDTLATLASAPVIRIPFPAPQSVDSEPPEAQPRSEGERLRLLTIGMVNRNKMIEEVIRVIGKSRFLRERVTYQILGDHARNVSYYSRLTAAIAELDLNGVVEVLGYQGDDVLRRYLSRADIVVNLRNPHFGEGSWSLLETVFAGKPTVVWKHGFYDEFPEGTVGKVASLDDLQAALERMCGADSERQEMGRRAAVYARQTFVTSEYCERLLEFCTTARYNAPALGLADFVSARLAELLGPMMKADLTTIDRIAGEVAAVAGIGASPLADPASPPQAVRELAVSSL